MLVKTIIAGMYEENCYLLIDEDTKECGIIDPGGNGSEISAVIKKFNLTPKYILLTHGHSDHVGAVEELSKEYGIQFYISKTEEEYMNLGNQVFTALPKTSAYVKENDTISLGKHIIKVIETPGHTKGGVCYLIEDKIFTGDTLFRETVGRSDLFGGDGKELIKNIKEKLLILSDNIEVYPGHGSSSTIGHEKIRNPFLQ